MFQTTAGARGMAGPHLQALSLPGGGEQRGGARGDGLPARQHHRQPGRRPAGRSGHLPQKLALRAHLHSGSRQLQRHRRYLPRDLPRFQFCRGDEWVVGGVPATGHSQSEPGRRWEENGCRGNDRQRYAGRRHRRRVINRLDAESWSAVTWRTCIYTYLRRATMGSKSVYVKWGSLSRSELAEQRRRKVKTVSKLPPCCSISAVVSLGAELKSGARVDTEAAIYDHGWTLAETLIWPRLYTDWNSNMTTTGQRPWRRYDHGSTLTETAIRPRFYTDWNDNMTAALNWQKRGQYDHGSTLKRQYDHAQLYSDWIGNTAVALGCSVPLIVSHEPCFWIQPLHVYHWSLRLGRVINLCGSTD